ncbi:MAG: hypothetical protein GY804_04645 [Alphaproteobacteria bacterium]|nr:hypothetical protein [Alphaproteobacteria bacterium]
MICDKCNNEFFKIKIIDRCSGCEHNGYYDEKEEEYLHGISDMERTQVNENGECEMGPAWGAGCHMYICSKCSNTTNMGILEE